MTWERITSRGSAVTCAWRRPGGKGVGFQLAVTLSTHIREVLGLARGHRLVLERDRTAGKLRITVSQHDGKAPQWKKSANADCVMVFVPLADVTLAEQKPAQTVSFDLEPGALTIKLPHWACTFVQITGRRAA